MEDSLGYSAEEPELQSVSKWGKHQDKYMLAERESSKEFLQYKSYHLHLKRKSFLASVAACIIVTCTTLLCALFSRILRSGYTFVFGKNGTIYARISISIILAAIFELFAYVSNGIQILDFLLSAVFAKNPWNICPEEGYYKRKEMKIYCYHLGNIAERIKNKTVIFDKMHYNIVEDNENFQFGQIYYYNYRQERTSYSLMFLYGSIIWILMAICYNKIYGRYIWKTLHIFHNIILSFFIITYSYHLATNEDIIIPDINRTIDRTTKYFPELSFNFFSISIIAPPVVHILSARSSDEVHPSRDSITIIMSNLLYSVIKLLHGQQVKKYLEAIAQLPLYMPGTNHMNSIFILFPLYFSTFYFGDVFSLLYFLTIFVTELCTSIIHLELTLEVISNLWKKMPRRTVALILVAIAVVMYIYVYVSMLAVMFFNKMTVMLLEVIIIYCMYPVFRLTDDMSFHLGCAVHTCRLYLMIGVPLFFMYKVYNSLNTAFVHLMDSRWSHRMVTAMLFAYPSAGVPVVAGMFYAYYKYVLKERRSWRRLFAPAEDWGPKDYVVRQLRKDYDSRTYTNSDVSRSLSRHIFAKTEKKAYELDIYYDSNRRSTQIGYEMKGVNK